MLRLLIWWVTSLVSVVYCQQPNLWPLPQYSTNGSKTIALCSEAEFRIDTTIESNILSKAEERFRKYLTSPEPLLIPNKPINSKKDEINEKLSFNLSNLLCYAQIQIESDDETLSLDTNVNYTLRITEKEVVIESGTVYGAIYGLTTLTQLINSYKNQSIILNSPWSITDYPIFKHRGLMIDTSRQYLETSMIYKILFAMSLNKLNVLHWHIIDAQSFPFQSMSNPKLSEYGAYSSESVYSIDDIASIVSLGKELGIRIIPEFDTPGHTMILSFSEPNLMECDAINDNTGAMCPEPPCGYLNVLNESSYKLVYGLYNDSFNLFEDEYFHLGGDEVDPLCWGDNTNAYYEMWIQNVSGYLCNNDISQKKPIIWSNSENINFTMKHCGTQNTNTNTNKTRNKNKNTHNKNKNKNKNKSENANKGTVIQVWDSPINKLIALENGFTVIDSMYNEYYLDCGFGNWITGGNSWCDPYKTWMNIYNYSLYTIVLNSSDSIDIKSEYKNQILGGEVCLWAELADSTNVEAKLWPRGGAAAERWWRNVPLLTNTDVNRAFYRLSRQREWMLWQGIYGSPIQPRFCLLHPQYCEYYRNSTNIFGNGEINNEKKNQENKTDMLKQYGLERLSQRLEDKREWELIDQLGDIFDKLGIENDQEWLNLKKMLQT